MQRCLLHQNNLLLYTVSCKDVVLSPIELAKHFKYKSFPRGLASIKQIVVEKLGKKVGKDFGEILNPFGDNWEVHWTDGSTEMIQKPKKNLALSLQPAQELMMNGQLWQCTHYDSKGCHLVLSAEGQPPTKRTRSSATKNPRQKSTRSPTKKTRKKSTTSQDQDSVQDTLSRRYAS